MTEKKNLHQPWYKDGLKFKCTGCGACCTSPEAGGYVWVSEQEIVEMASFLKIELQEFADKYLKRVGSRYALRDHVGTYDCIFLEDKKCTLYQHRPIQCRTFPFWPDALTSKKAWQELGKDCEGVDNPEASITPFEEIEKQRIESFIPFPPKKK